MTDAATLLWSLALHLALTGAPLVAGMLLAARRGVRSVALLLCIGLAASGASAMLTFWGYFAEPALGKACAYAIVAASVAGIAWSWPRLRDDRDLLRGLGVPLALWILASCFLVFLGFVHGGTDEPLAMAANRFSHPLPGDNDIPRYFADWYYEHGHDGRPPEYAGWLSSDRPPLQTGYTLAQRPFVWDSSGLQYQVLGVVLQQLWILGLWALLLAARVGPGTRALALVGVLIGDVAIVNGFFVWPKLLGAAFVLGAAALVLSPVASALRRNPPLLLLLVALAMLAMLSHGTSVFGLIPVAAIAVFRGLPGWRWVAAGVLVGAILWLPWTAYQRYHDPPGNHVLKLTLAGVPGIDKRGTTEAIVDSYREAGLSTVLDNKWQNFLTMAGADADARRGIRDAFDSAASGEIEQSIVRARGVRFFSLLPALGLFVLGPLIMLVGYLRGQVGNRDEWRFALACWAIFAVGCIIWGLVLFGLPGAKAWVHVGSLALLILAIAGSVAGVRATYPRLAAWLVGVNAVIVAVLYVPAFEPLAGTSYSPPAALLALAALAGFFVVAHRAALTETGSTLGGSSDKPASVRSAVGLSRPA